MATKQYLTSATMISAISADTYLSIGTGSQGAITTAAWARTFVAAAGVLSNMRVDLTVAPGAGQSWVFTVYKNGSSYKFAVHDANSNNGICFDPFLSAVVDMNGTTDYLEGFTNINVSSGTPSAQGSANKRTYFGAYKLGA